VASFFHMWRGSIMKNCCSATVPDAERRNDGAHFSKHLIRLPADDCWHAPNALLCRIKPDGVKRYYKKRLRQGRAEARCFSIDRLRKQDGAGARAVPWGSGTIGRRRICRI